MGNDTDTTMETLKGRMRHAAIAKRKTVSEAERAAAGKTLAGQAKALLAGGRPVSRGVAIRAANHDQHCISLVAGDTVAAYVSMGTEVPTLDLLEWLLERGARVLVPRLGAGRDIGWSEYTGQNGLREMPRTATGGLRPEEPNGEVLGPEAIENVKIVFIPAFAIDLDGTRLGRGGGWYDQVLGLCRPDAIKVGVCWDWECIDEHDAAPHEAHDLPVDAVITPERSLWLHPRRTASGLGLGYEQSSR
ncbi:5-formyltetrahydrofolate cyclo-ligase [Bifidobacterium sp. ESL0775]|uniref:5-formyltetrahydrofolate cyclo-ligase n=1 Tax=Bifidobacterium sp. ESL0775 TaxID=2983230 RepID=UPI0023F6F4D8|nr:5-formyltetrahydrofolate cyclo-ligase [Bifidobacterium sp. ESL0775]WEV69040.1 5-formyltetrahydrofolate cyclo-ligase [Bifidobacterium sp. ESL0775]